MPLPPTTPPVGSPVRTAALLCLLVLMAALLPGSAPAFADRQAPVPGVWPLRPRPVVVAGFDPPTSRFGAGHRGVDLAGHPGQPVLAAAPGRVTFAGRLAGRGVVVVDHGATRTTYEPVSAAVPVGRTVDAGALIGHLEVFGSHCFPRSCLHWGLIEGRDHYLDPLSLVGVGPVRLLPLDGTVPGLAAPGPPVLVPPTFAGRRGTAALLSEPLV